MSDYSIQHDRNVIIISQDNISKKLFINHISDKTLEMLSFSKEEKEKLQGHDISLIFSESSMRIINEYVEYEHDGNTIDNVLRRMPFCDFIKKSGLTIKAKIKPIVYMNEVRSAGHLITVVVYIRDISIMDLMVRFIAERNHIKPVADQYSGMLHDETLKNILPLYEEFAQVYSIPSAIYYIKISNNQQGIVKIGTLLKKNTRHYDQIGYLGGSTIYCDDLQ